MDALDIRPDGTYVDVTFGGGGHSRRILEKLTTGRLFAFDQDSDAKANASHGDFHRDGRDRSFTFVDSNFRHLKRQLRFYGVSAVDGILADLGVSSHQFDEDVRGFSTRFDGPLDMRMDQSSSLTAQEVINTYELKDLVHLFSAYGEVKNAKTLAAAVVRARGEAPIATIGRLKDVVAPLSPKGKNMKYLAQLFQAIRIEVNDEMGALYEFLEQTADLLRPGGRLVVMSYHSLEDRPVKNYIATGNIKGKQEKDFYGNLIRPFQPVNRKPIVPEEEEIKENNRARSAKLRIGERNK